MAELEITKDTYDQLLQKLKHWRHEGRRLQRQLQQEANPAPDKPSKELLQARAQLEEVTSRISQLEARLQSVRIIEPRNNEH
jgi:transcription elongation GreA/GreB family factor